jgi:carbon-monoxide dehydrogenase small subunit
MKRIGFKLNGEKVSAEVDDCTILVDLLRDQFQLTGTKIGCGYGECGACTVLLNGMAVNSCLILAAQIEDQDVETIEGIAKREGELHPIQETFIEHGAIQCGYCTPGMIMAAKAFLEENPDPTEDEVKKGIGGNLCRCTGYTKIMEAILQASGR